MIKATGVFILLLISTFNSCSSKNYVKETGSTITADEIITMLNEGKDIYMEDKTITGTIDFTKLKRANKESKSINRINVSSSLTFVHCIFTGKIIGYNADDKLTNLVAYRKNFSCIECEFKEEVTLRESNFYGAVNFSGASFLKKVSFEGSNFTTDAYFSKTSFSDEARFQNVVLHNKINFMEAICGKTISFQGVSFFGDAQFGVVKFLAYADFSVATFSSGCFFNYAEFSNQAIFSHTVFKGRAEFLKNIFSANTEFKNCVFYNAVKMNDATISSVFNLQNATFMFSKPDFSNYNKTEQTKIIFENARVNSYQPLTDKDF